MKRVWITLFGLAIFLGVAGTAFACGDKMLALGRGVRFNRAFKCAKPASVLVFYHRDPTSGVEKQAAFESLLKQAGHKPEIINTTEQFATALQSRSYDVVLAQVGDVAGIDSIVPASFPKPVLVVTLYKPDKNELRQAQQHYRYILNGPKTAFEVLAAIDQAMAFRTKHNEMALR